MDLGNEKRSIQEGKKMKILVEAKIDGGTTAEAEVMDEGCLIEFLGNDMRWEMHETFVERIDENNEVVLEGITYTPSMVLIQVDSIHYNELFDNYINDYGVEIYGALVHGDDFEDGVFKVTILEE